MSTRRQHTLATSTRVLGSALAALCVWLLLTAVPAHVGAKPQAGSTQQLAIWTFDGAPTFSSGAEMSPTLDSVDGSPVLVMNDADIEANGAPGVAYTDVDGNVHPADMAAAWSDIKKKGAPDAEWIVKLDTTGWSDISIRFDYKSASSTGYNLEFSTDSGASWTSLRTQDAIVADAGLSTWSVETIDLTTETGIENRGSLWLRFDHFEDTGNDEFYFDNFEITGVKQTSNPNAPSIQVDNSTTAFLTLPSTGSGFVSGVIDDSTDPARILGIVFALSDPDTPVSSLQMTKSSSNTTMVPEGNLTLTGSGIQRTLRITPTGVGYTDITVQVSDGSNTDSYVIQYAASAAPTANPEGNPALARFHTGLSDASSAIAVDDDFMFVVNDELIGGKDGVYLVNRSNSGAPVKMFDFSAELALSKEADLEASTRVGDTIYWLASHSNNKDGKCRADRYRLFGTTITGSGAGATLTYTGRYDFLRDDLIAWDQQNGARYGFAAGAACAPSGGVPAKDQTGFNIEGLARGPSSDAVGFIAFRAPISPANARTRALIVPITNMTALLDINGGGTTGSAQFGSPIELDLGGRGIRSIARNADNEYLIIAGSWGSGNDDPSHGFQLYTWTGLDPAVTRSAADQPHLLNSIDLDKINADGSWESIVEMPTPLAGSQVQLLVDNGTAQWYADGKDSKDLSPNWQKFRSEWVTLPAGAPNTPTSVIYLPTLQRSAKPVVLVPTASTWRYLDNGADQGTAWRASAFDDSGWQSGQAELGYGDTQVTQVSFGPDSGNKYITTYFRREFTISDPASFRSLDLQLQRDDGAVVYLNGVEVMRSNMPAGAVAFDTRASVAIGGVAETTFYAQSVPADRLVPGRNMLAVEVHQANPTSSDISFDLGLTAMPLAASTELIRNGSRWSYLDDGTDQGTAWRASAFDDSGWSSGRAELGYGDTQVTEVSFGPDSGNKYITTYFRHAFTVSDPASLRGLDLQLQRDDGAVVYLNGVEVMRSNVPAGAVAFDTRASVAIGGVAETTFYHTTLPATQLVSGRNVLAVEVHQANPTSSDISFDLSLRGIPGSGGVRFAAIGDYGNASSNEAAVATLVKSWRPDFIITLGDNNYNSGEASTIDGNIGQFYSDYIFPYTGSFGAGASENRFFPALGNHDWGTRSGNPPVPQPYLDYFSLPAGPGNERYYDFVQGPVHFFVVDSDPHEPDGTSSTSVQGQWLQGQLAAATEPWKIVTMHHPPYSSGSHGSQVYMQWPFTAWGASVVMAGHDHMYERFWRDDIPYFLNGAGGKSLYNFKALEEGSLAQHKGYGAMLIQNDNCSMLVQFMAPDGAVLDSTRFYSSASGCP